MISTRSIEACLRACRVIALAGGVFVGISNITSTTQASLIAMASNSGPESLNTGLLSLNVTRDGISGGWSNAINAMAPGDTQYRYVNVEQGTSAANNPTITISDLTPTLLSTDPLRGLSMTIISCSLAWSYTIGQSTPATCSGNVTTLLSNSLSSLTTPTPFAIKTAANSKSFLQIKYFLPLSAKESATDGQAPSAVGAGNAYYITAENSFANGVETLYTPNTAGLTVGQIITITYDGPGTNQNVYSYTVSGNPVTSINPNVSFTVNAGGSGYFTTPLVGRTAGGPVPSILGLSANIQFSINETQRSSTATNQ